MTGLKQTIYDRVSAMKPRARARPYVRAGRRFLHRELSVNEIGYGFATSMSQFGEDVLLANLFEGKDDGFFVDVGALHPSYASNTFNLSRRGWKGINIEPQPSYFALFEKFRPQDTNLKMAISDTAGMAKFAPAHALGGIVDDNYTHIPADDAHIFEVSTAPLSEVLTKHLPPGVHIDVLDVDCEGGDAAVLRSNDWDRFRPSVVLTEQHFYGLEPSMPFGILSELGYRLFCRLGPTGIFVDPAFMPTEEERSGEPV